MVTKKLLFIFILLSPVSTMNPWSITLDKKVFQQSIIDRFETIKTANSTELPTLPLIQKALTGYEILLKEQSLKRPEVITIIDFGLSSDKKRLWVLDLFKAKVLYHCLVAHGRNSGGLTAEYFSNNPNSYASSPGFYTTGATYFGKNGLSLVLDGLERGINDKARERAIVIHGADYVSADFIKKNGRLGRSFGCPAVPEELSKEIIQTIKGGSCLFINTPKASYAANSTIINEMVSSN